MSKGSKFIFPFTLPFFVALVFMLSVFTQTIGSMLQRDSKKITDFRFKHLAQVLGTSTVANEEINVKSVVTGGDGSRTEINSFSEDNVNKVTVSHYDMFGAKISEKTYEKTKYEKLSNKELKTKTSVSLVPSKLAGLGYTYNSAKISTINTKSGELFKVPAYSMQKLLGFIPVRVPVVLFVDPYDPAVRVDKTVFAEFVDFLSK